MLTQFASVVVDVVCPTHALSFLSILYFPFLSSFLSSFERIVARLSHYSAIFCRQLGFNGCEQSTLTLCVFSFLSLSLPVCVCVPLEKNQRPSYSAEMYRFFPFQRGEGGWLELAVTSWLT